jgi:hypothetical protein
MLGTMLLALTISAQAPTAAKPAPPPQPPAATATTTTPEQLKAQRAADLKKAVEKKKADAANRARLRTNRTILTYQQQQAQAAYEAKMAPVIAQQQADAARLAIEQQRANALSSMANAAQRQAAVDLGRLRLQQQQVGIPFIPTPNGMVAYPYAPGATNP